jgi:hypothetical protein
VFGFIDRLLGRPDGEPLRRIDVEREIIGSDSVRLITLQPSPSGRKLELAEVPLEIEQESIDLLARLAERIETEKPTRDGDAIAGAFVADEQPVVHIATLRIVSRTIVPGSEELFRIVDYEEAASERLPQRLLATHLALLAWRATSSRTKLELARRSIDLFPGEPAGDDGEFAFGRGENLGNFLAWEMLGDGLVDTGDPVAGLEALRNATLRCPAWARDFAAHLRSTPNLPENDPRVEFWLDYEE